MHFVSYVHSDLPTHGQRPRPRPPTARPHGSHFAEGNELQTLQPVSPSTMTVDTLCNEFNIIQLDENNRLNTSRTPVKSVKEFRPISPTDDDSVVSSSSSVSTAVVPSASSRDGPVSVSDHKRAELNGEHADEPLLMDNPNRFVLFPIQDNEVRVHQQW